MSKMGAAVVAGLGTIIGAVLLMAVIGPFFTIWALNHLFGFDIPVTFWTWLSVSWLHLVLGGRNRTSTKTKS
jgi:hypothetical protein